ncbi:peroxidase family protein [Rhizobium sp. BK176]|uniref:peroxidase family protein n=2 Tax=unclassified Rhizobium TaxID=2613769 RepID=UPI00286DCA15|nr:peroxidase family protein [Rhizobium sp. BK176]MCS4095543.1 Ca2+-binding RTX toxin-like protein [Rhizobium sp. BK176]
MVQFIRSDLDFILQQIIIAERNANGESLTDILPNAEVPLGLRTVDGSFNNLVHPEFGAADLAFPRLTDPSFQAAESGTSYATPGTTVVDSEPRTISNLIVDQTDNNPAAQAAAAQTPGSSVVMSPGLDGLFGTADDTPVNFIPNVTADAGLSAPFNAWMTFFGQFFDHGLDLVTKSQSQTEVVFIPLKPDDPLFSTAPGALNFMVLQRAAGGLDATNTTSPFVDQSQTYASNPSHQVFLRAYELNANGDPVATGELITNRNLGADGLFGTGDDVEIGGMATWAVVKAQARDILGINLTDADVGNVPVLAVDAYGNFIKGPNGMPLVMMTDGSFTEGNLAAPISLAGAARTGHAFLNDIAHNADPTGKTPDADNIVNTGPLAAGQYDNELLDAHYIAGDGRVNENIGLTAVHAVFHSEHNRLVEQTKDTVLTSGDLAFLKQWLIPDTGPDTFPTTSEEIAALQWNGERLFQAARFGTEMQYQHLVFEEFARTVQPQVDEFLAPNGYDTTINPAILAEFAHTVYRFGHSMLTETVDRLDPNFNTVGGDPQLGLIAAFLNPLAYANSGLTPEQATGAIVRGVTRQVGNEIDEFVTEALRNNLLGLPLDLPALNIARGRDTGIPSFNNARAEFFAMTGDSQLKPYISWADFADHLKHAESLINFIAAYGTHPLITSATTLVDKRAIATAIVLGGAGAPGDRLDFLNATGAYAGGSLGGLNDVDFWIGGLAEEKMPFGGMLGSTFNFVFETQLESLQNGDRFYYLSRTAGMHFGTELENNSFAKLVMLNSDATHLPNAIFTTPAFTLEVDQTRQHTGLGADGRADPTGGLEINGIEVVPLVIRDNPATGGVDTNYLHYTGEDHVVLGGTAGDDIIISSEGDDTLYGDGGNDRLEGGAGNDTILGGDGDDILSDSFGDNRIEGGAGNDVIVVGSMSVLGNLILGGDGQDFIITTEDISTTFGGTGDDFILGAKTNLPPTGNEGDDWIEMGTQDGAPGDNFSPVLADDVIGNDIFIGGGGFDEMIGEGGDDIFTGSDAQDKMDGMSGFDWVTYLNDRFGVTVDLTLAALAQPHGAPATNIGAFQPIGASPASILDRFAEVEGLSGSRYADVLRGDDVDAVTIVNHGGATGGALTNVALIDQLDALLGGAGLSTTGFATGNIILGGDGSDIIEGRGGDDLIDGDKWLNVRIGVYAADDINHTGTPIASFDNMVQLMPFMLAGTYNPGQLHAIREIMDGSSTGGNAFDTAVFSGNRADYTVTIDDRGTADFSDDIVTVADSVVARDGTDTLTHIERLQFADEAQVVVPGLNAEPVGLLEIRDATTHAADGTPTAGQLLEVSIAGVTDGDNPDSGAITESVSYYWQVDRNGDGVFEDIILLPAGDLAFLSADGVNFRVTPDLVGLPIRVKAYYQDAHGVTETVFSAPTAAIAAAPVVPPTVAAPLNEVTAGGAGIHMAVSDLQFILDQIKIAEAHAHGASLLSLIPNVRSPLGLRAVDGSNNNLVHLNGIDQSEFGAADNTFPRVVPPNFLDEQDESPFSLGPGGPPPVTNTNYNSSISVVDSDPRTISNLVVDQTANNPAAYAAAFDPGLNGQLDFGAPGNDDVLKDGVSIVKSPGIDGLFGTADDKDVFKIDAVAPDVGLSAPFNSWFTFFGQFFDHGLDLVTKGGNGTIYIPLQPDDPLYVPGGNSNFMVVTRATQAGPDGILLDNPATAVDESADNTHAGTNTTTPFVDQNQTYSSHPSHQVFLRAYSLDGTGAHATGKLITNWDLGADGHFGGGDDREIGGMATWKVVKAQANDILGINLTDADFDNVPLLATDAYGNFIRGPNGFPQVVMKGADGIGGTSDDVLVEGNPLAPISLANAVRTGHAFLNDIAHNAVPVFNAGVLAPDADTDTGNAVPVGPGGNNLAYDNELLDAHYIAGDGRVNENIGLTAVHSIFHHEHNRLVDQTKETVLAANNLDFLKEWLVEGTGPAAFPTTPTEIAALQWDGERLFQAAKFGTEMQYQHLVFEEFARTIQPNVDLFFAPTQVYDADLDPSIVAEFAHTVYRFGHSMLTETVDRYDENFNVVGDGNPTEAGNQQTGLIAAFLNPLAFAASGTTPEDATSAIVRGVTRQVGNEIDEFVTEALRNNLLGLPLDLPAINIARGRDVGIPSLNAVRRDIYRQTGNSDLKPYTSWADLVQHLKHAESVINFIAAYGTHDSITTATTTAAKRAAATLLVLGGAGEPADRLDFLNSTGTWASLANGVTTTGLDAIDLWIGGLAEEKNPFGGMLGSTFNFIFENQLEKLQDGDRFYYLERTAGLAFNAELEGNSFAKLIMANTSATHLSALVFSTPTWTLEVDPTKQFTGLGADGRADPTEGGTDLNPLVVRDNPDTAGPDSNYIKYTGEDHIVLGGTNPGSLANPSGNDILISGAGDDTVYGDGGNDRIEGGYGNDQLRGGDGNDIITDIGGDDNIQGGDGDDVIQGGNGVNLIIGGFGSDFIITGEDASEAIGGQGNDFILGSKANEQDMGNEGDDWIEKGTSDGAPGDNFDPLGNDPIIGNDVFIGDGENDKFNAEGGDDIMVGKTGFGDRYIGGSGYDWADFKDNERGVYIDISDRFFDSPQMPGSQTPLIRFDIVEGISGSHFGDVLHGNDVDAAALPTEGATGSVLTNIALINGLQELLDTAYAADLAPGAHKTFYDGGNIILGGDGSDIIEGRGGDDVIDGDKWLNVRIAVYAAGDTNHTGPEIASFDSMADLEFQARMLDGTWSPGQLNIVREIKTGTAAFDTAVFSGRQANYTITTVGGLTTVTDNVGTDGTDRLTNIERLQFSDGSVLLPNAAPGVTNAAPSGVMSILDGVTPVETAAAGTVLTVSFAGITDADNVSATNPTGTITGPVDYFWQVETVPGSGVYEDILTFGAGEVERAHGTSFTVTDGEAGLNLRVRALYQDGHGTLEQIYSALPPIPGVGVTLVGTRAADTLTGTAFADTITGDRGDDIILGLGGSDTIDAGRGADTVDGGDGDDTILGDRDNDILNGGAGDDTIDGGRGDDIINGGPGNDTILGDRGNDLIIVGSTDGRDIIDGGRDTDTVQIVGDATTENFKVYASADAIAAGITIAAATQIVITRNDVVVAELANIEEIQITGGGGGDTFQVIGNFAPTTLLTSTITIDGSAGDDTVDISSLTSAHRIVFTSNGGHDTIVGTLRPQDVIKLAPGSTLADYTSTTANGMTTMSNGTHSVTFASAGTPTFEAGSGSGSGSGGDTGGNGGGGNGGGGGNDNPGGSGAFHLTASDLTALKNLVNGLPGGEDNDAVGIRDLEGTGNNRAHADYGSADQPFIRLTGAHFGDYNDTIHNRDINPLFNGLDPRAISNALGTQEPNLPTSAEHANSLFMAFGQYFDHGLDFLPKGGNGTIQIGAAGAGHTPGTDNPADLTRGTVSGFDANGIPENLNKTSPFADQNQAYGSDELVGQFLREGDGHGGFSGRLLAGAPDPSNPDFNLLPNLRELIMHHWANNTVFTAASLPGGHIAFRDYFAGLVDATGHIDETMLPQMTKNFMGSGFALLLDTNPFISLLDHYVAGDGRANENVALTAIHTIWARNHNFHVAGLLEAGFAGTAEELFQAAKVINEAEYQRVVYTEFADKLLGGMKGDGEHGFNEYNPDVDARVSHEFATAAYRFGHSLIGQNLTVMDAQGHPTQVALFDAFLNPTNDVSAFTAPLPPGYVPQPGYEQLGINGILAGGVVQPAEEVDVNLVDAVRNDLVRSSADVFAFDVAREWDVGLGSMNQIRADLLASTDPYVHEAVGFAGDLNPYTSWEDFQTRNGLSDTVINQFRQAYPDLVLQAGDIAKFKQINPNIDVAMQPDGTGVVKGIDRVDLFVGGLAEKHINGGVVGQTFWVILHEQLDRIQEGDRLYYLDRVENLDFYDIVEEQGFAAIIARNTGLTGLPEDIFGTNQQDNQGGGDDGQTGGGDDGQTGGGDDGQTGGGDDGQTGGGDDGQTGGGDDGQTGGGDDGQTGGGDDGQTGGGDDGQTGGGDGGGNGGGDDDGQNQGGGDDDGSGDGGTDPLPVAARTLIGTVAGDVLIGAAGADTILAGGGGDIVAGDAGNDILRGEDGDDVVTAGDGNDSVTGGAGDDELHGGAGDDMLFGNAGKDMIHGEAGNDFIEGGAGEDQVWAGDGDDTVIASAGDGDDQYWGGYGNDTLDYAVATANLTVDLGNGFMQRGQVSGGSTGTDVVYGFENVITGSGHDTITATAAVNVMDGGLGNDTFRFLSAGAANGDVIHGFQPGDKIDFAAIDANSGMDGVQHFSLASGGALTAAGQVVVTHEVLNGDEFTVIHGNVDSNTDADFVLMLKGNYNLTASDFNGVS